MKSDPRQFPIPFSTSFIPVLPGIQRLPFYRNLCLFPTKVVYDYHKALHGRFSCSMCRNGRLSKPWRGV